MNIKTLRYNNRIDILTDEIRCLELNFSRNSYPRGKKHDNIEFIYSGRNDGVHRQRVGLMMSNEAAKSCLC